MVTPPLQGLPYGSLLIEGVNSYIYIYICGLLGGANHSQPTLNQLPRVHPKSRGLLLFVHAGVLILPTPYFARIHPKTGSLKGFIWADLERLLVK